MLTYPWQKETIMLTYPQLLEKLVALKNLFLEKGWTQGVYARDADYQEVPFNSEEAFCFCFEGGLRKITQKAGDYDWDANLIFQIRKFIIDQNKISYRTIVGWNDDPARTKEEVIRAIDVAIEKCQLLIG